MANNYPVHSSLQYELAISIGNTHIQYGVFSNDHATEPLRVKRQSYIHQKNSLSKESASSITLEQECKEIIHSLHKIYPITKAYLASVNPGINSALKKVINRELNLYVYILTYKDLSVHTEYDVKAMGIDRLLKIHAANILAPRSNLIILDFGTAITLDTIRFSEYPKHIGGMIVSGFHTSLRALHTFTEQLPSLTFSNVSDVSDKSFLPPSYPPLLGNDTNSAILSGSYHFYLEAIDGLIAKTMLEFFRNEECRIWITGGDAHYFYNRLESPVEYIEQLNLIALKIAIEQSK